MAGAPEKLSSLEYGGFKTTTGIKISFLQKDITTYPADCVVCAVDEKISCSSGSSLDIKKALGQPMTEECSKKQKMAIKEVHAIKGEPRWRYILLARCTGWNEVKPQTESASHLTDIVYNCFKTAEVLKMTSIALPLVGSGGCGIPEHECFESYKKAVKMFDSETHSSLENISFVDINLKKIQGLQGFLSATIKATETLRLVLVGKTGIGKSMMGNKILSNNCFQSLSTWKSVTSISSIGKRVYNGYDIEVVDTPGLFDASDDEDKDHDDKILKEILKSIIFALPGPHVFCLLFRADARFTKSEVEVYMQLEALFQVELKRYLMVVLTHSPKNGEHSLENILKDAPHFFDKLLVDVNRRVVGIDSTGSDANTQVQELLAMALKIRNENTEAGSPYYTNSLTNRCLQLLQSDKFAAQTLEQIKDEVKREESKAITLVKNDPEVKQTVQESKRRWCVIL